MIRSCIYQISDTLLVSIVMDKEYIKEVTFAYLEMIGIKRGKKERGRYKALADVLKTMGINLVIV